MGPGRGTQPHLTESLWLCDAKKPKPNTPKNPQGAEYPSLLPLPTLPVAKQSQAGAVWEGIFALMPSVVPEPYGEGVLAFPPATLQCCCFYGNYFLFNKRSLKSVGLNPILGRSICSFSRGSSAGAVRSWLSLLQGRGVSKPPSQRPFLVIPPHISTFWFSSDGSCQSTGTVCTCCVLQGISVSLQGKLLRV